MRVYVYTCVWQFDSGDTGMETRVFECVDDAQDLMEEVIVSCRQEMKHFEVEETNYVRGDMSWSIWEKENYCYNHIDITIVEREVE